MSSMKVAELRSLARERGLRGYSKLRKAELINLLESTPAAQPVLQPPPVLHPPVNDQFSVHDQFQPPPVLHKRPVGPDHDQSPDHNQSPDHDQSPDQRPVSQQISDSRKILPYEMDIFERSEMAKKRSG